MLNLPKAAEAAVALNGDSGGQVVLGAMEQVRGAMVAESGVTLVLVPVAKAAQGAVGVAMAARGTGSSSSQLKRDCDEKPEWHHVATVENSKSALRGGPWTPPFQKLFDRVGLSMENAANKVLVKGHRGPHPEEYHRAVYEELNQVLRACTTPESCREKFIATLRRLANEIATAGTDLNRLVTRGCGS